MKRSQMFPINPFQNPAPYFSDIKRDNNPFSSDMETCEYAIKLKLDLKTYNYGNTIEINPSFNICLIYCIFISANKLCQKKAHNPCSNNIIPPERRPI